MRRSLNAGWLPESYDDALSLSPFGLRFRACCECNISLVHPDAASSPAGWRETQISSLCEPCFDAVCEEIENEGD